MAVQYSTEHAEAVVLSKVRQGSLYSRVECEFFLERSEVTKGQV